MVIPRFVLIALGVIPLLGQGVIRVQTREVVVDVTVTDSKNIPVSDLEKQDFTVLDEGKPRVIDAFSVTQEYPPISAAPSSSPLRLPTKAADVSGTPVIGHSTAIILDEANSWFADAAQARQNVIDLMAKLPADERIALYIIVRKKGLVLVQDYTTDRDSVKRNLAQQYPTKLGTREDFNADQPSPPYDGPPPDNEAQADMMWRENSDAARYSLQALAEQLAQVPGRKSVFWVTNALNPKVVKDLGLDIGWDKTITALNEADVAVNTVDSRGLYGASNQVTGTVGFMRYVSEGTGGNTYFNRNDLDGAIAEGIAASRSNYTLRFHLADDERDKQYHALMVKVDRPGLELYYRQGYYAGGTETPVDLVAGKIAGQTVEARATSGNAGLLDADVQLPYFYAGANRANVHLTVDLSRTGLQGQAEIVGIAMRPDGSEAARFADTARADGHYVHTFMIGAGSYVFRLEVGGGTGAVSQKEVPLQIEPWNAGSFGIGGIALSTEARPAQGPMLAGTLVAAGKEFAPSATNRFRKSDRVYFYTEIHDPVPGNASSLTMQYKILDQKTGEVKIDTGMVGAANYVRPGDPVVPFATALPVARLEPGLYRLEVRAAHASEPEVVTRVAEFEVAAVENP